MIPRIFSWPLFIILLGLGLCHGQECERDDFKYINGRCYWLDTVDIATWVNSQIICESVGANLLALETPFEWLDLKEVLEEFFGQCSEWASPNAEAWIGAYPRASDQKWVWVPNEEEVLFFDWLNGQDPPPDPSFGALISCYNQYQWVTQPLDVPNHFFCEKEPMGVSTSTTESTTMDSTTTPTTEETSTTTPMETSTTTLSTTTPGGVGCPPGYTEIPLIGCYYYSTVELNFFAAIEDCNTKGGKLVEIETIDEYNNIIQFIDSSTNCTNGESIYIGALEAGFDEDYRWLTTGREVSFYPWFPGEPNIPFENDNALSIFCTPTKVFGYNDITGQESFATTFVCEAPYFGPGTTTTGGPSNCPPSYDEVPGTESCYRVADPDDAQLLPDALATCQSEGGSLAEFEDAFEWNLVKEYLIITQPTCSSNFRFLYVGALELGVHREYYWLISGGLATIYEWHVGEPSAPGGDDGLAISCGYGGDLQWKFNDITDWSTYAYGYMCEIPIPT